MSKLVIVESPTKTKSLSKYLGKDYVLKASLGHIRDLPKSELGVDVAHNFEPAYEIMKGKKKVVGELKAAAKDSDEICLATDPDREGEAIAYHIFDLVGSKPKTKNQKPKISRVVFHEITKDAILEAFKHPRSLDFDLIDAWKARRILDRLVGYKLSPLLWKKVRYGLSAGRVQSVAVRLIVEREREREDFKSEEYWKINAKLKTQNSPQQSKLATGQAKPQFKTQSFLAELIKKNDKKLEIKNKNEADDILKTLKGASYIVEETKTEERRRYPAPPFTTSTLQQVSFNSLGSSSQRTMRAAQNLYEQGLITYHRTDSTHLATSAVDKIRKLISNEFGGKYLPEKPIFYKTKAKVAQEAHEAIRPTDVGLQVKNSRLPSPGVEATGGQTKSKVQNLERDEARLYELIWKRAVACQMNPAVFEQQTVDIAAGEYLFRASGQTLKFDGWMRILQASENQKELPVLDKGEKLSLIALVPSQHFTQPPARYTEATLIKELEKHGIGRPSTYAPIINTILERGYVSREEKALKPEDVGRVVNDLLVEHFPKVVDIEFTAHLEDDLDKIADGKKKWMPVIKDFYEPFEKQLNLKEKELKKKDLTTLERTSEKCPECGKPLIVKLGKYGKFLSCSRYPKCEYGRPYEDKDGDGKPDEVDKMQFSQPCPKCGGELVLKEGRFGKFIACKNYPKCKFTRPYLNRIGLKCPGCQKGDIIIKRTRRGKIFYGCSRYPECKYASWKNPRQKLEEKS